MFSAVKQFDATVHRNSRKNFNNPPESKDKLAASKSVVMENRAMANVISLSLQSDIKINLTQLMMHCITDSCLSIFNVNSQLFQLKIVKKKMKLVIHGVTIAKKMFDMIIGRHWNASMIVLVNDPCDLDISIKDSEHIKRATDKGYL